MKKIFFPLALLLASFFTCATSVAQTCNASVSGLTASHPQTLQKYLCISSTGSTNLTLTGGTISSITTRGSVTASAWTVGGTTFTLSSSDKNKGLVKVTYNATSCSGCELSFEVYKSFSPQPVIKGAACLLPNQTGTYYSDAYVVSSNINAGVGTDFYKWTSTAGTVTQTSGDNSVIRLTMPSAPGAVTLTCTTGTTCNNISSTLVVGNTSSPVSIASSVLGTGWSAGGTAAYYCANASGTGTATFQATDIQDATYSWSITGGQSVSQSGRNATVTLVTGANARLTVTYSTPGGCSGNGFVDIYRVYASASALTPSTNTTIGIPDPAQIPSLVTPTASSSYVTPSLEYAFQFNGNTGYNLTASGLPSDWSSRFVGNTVYIIPGPYTSTTSSWTPAVTTNTSCNGIYSSGINFTRRTPISAYQRAASGLTSISTSSSGQVWPPAGGCAIDQYRYDWTLEADYKAVGSSTTTHYRLTNPTTGKYEDWPISVSFANSGSSIAIPPGTYGNETRTVLASPLSTCPQQSTYYIATVSAFSPTPNGPMQSGGNNARAGQHEDPITIYPNPANGYVHISVPASMAGSAVTIVSTKGHLVDTFEVAEKGTLYVTEKLPAGTYHVKVKGSGSSTSSTFVVD